MSSSGPSAKDVVKRVGDSNERALAYVRDPDPQLARMPRAHREHLVAELPPVTAGALLGPAALARHLVASAASGRYRDLFALWDLFRTDPDACRPVLADRPQALAKAQRHLRTAAQLGLAGRAERVAEDVAAAEGLIWQWLREILLEFRHAVAARPVVASALLKREPELDLGLPEEPGERWLAEAAAAAVERPLAPAVEARLAAGADRLPATIDTLRMARERYPEKLPAIIDRVDLDRPDVGALLAWARDHGVGDRLHQRIRQRLDEAARRDRREALALWRDWRERGVELDLPDEAKATHLDDLDLTRPESAELVAMLTAEGHDLGAQRALEDLAAANRQRAEKAYEAFVCTGLDVTLPRALEGNPIVKEGTRCPYCLAWTWVRPGHEQRCPRRREARAEEPTPAAEEPAAPAAEEPAAPAAEEPAAPAAEEPAAPAEEPAAEEPAAPAEEPMPAAEGQGDEERSEAEDTAERLAGAEDEESQPGDAADAQQEAGTGSTGRASR